MTGQQLKNSILQEAIEGRLVPQDPNDEPASVLLDKIRKEKARLVKEGKLKKKDLEEIPISEDEKPFDIPESWEWVRIKAILSLQAGKNVTSADIHSEQNGVFKYPCYGGNGLRGYVMNYNIEGSYPLIGRQGALCGNVNMAHGQFWATEHAVVTNGWGMTDVKWQYFFLIALNLNKYATATAQPGLAVSNIIEVPIPLPPLAEQKRIVEKIEELLPKVEEYGKAQEALDKLNEELPERLKKSILQEAIEGRLVPQDPNDEPASVLLDKIRKEKARLVKEGKLKKKDLEEIPISEDEKPFDIPESWEWCRVSSILNILDSQRKPVTKSDREAGIYPYCGANGILDYVKDYIFDGSFILVGEDGSVVTKYGNPIVNKIEGKIWVNNHAHILQEYGGLGYQEYIYYALMNIDISIYIHGFMPKYSQGDLRKTAIPLPPLAEQHRIVAKIEQLMNEIDK